MWRDSCQIGRVQAPKLMTYGYSSLYTSHSTFMIITNIIGSGSSPVS